jgi:thymidylate synthase
MIFDKMYLDALQKVLISGTTTKDRTSVGSSKQLFGLILRHTYKSKKDGFVSAPLVQSRIFSPRIAFEEWKWMMSGSTDVTELQAKNIHIWDGNSTREFLDLRNLLSTPINTIGKAYGYQFRNLPNNDQLVTLINNLKTDPQSRRHMVTLWNPQDLDKMALEPCSHTYNFVVINNKLNLMQHIRSNDLLYGNPYNYAFGMFWLLALSSIANIPVGEHVITVANAHIYKNQIDTVQTMIYSPKKITTTPIIKLNKKISTLEEMLNLELSDFTIKNFVLHSLC